MSPVAWRSLSILLLFLLPATVAADEAPATETEDVSWDGSVGTYVCTFGPLSHECHGMRGTDQFHVVGTYTRPLAVNGTVSLDGAATDPQRVDAFLYVDTGDGFRMVAYVTGPSPQTFDWDLSAYEDARVAVSVFSSHTAGGWPVGLSIVPDPVFRVDATLTRA